MPNVRILNDGRLVLSDGTKLDVEHVWLSQVTARAVAADAELIVRSSADMTVGVSSDGAGVEELLRDVDGREGTVGARGNTGRRAGRTRADEVLLTL